MTLFKNIFGARNRFATYSKGARQVVKTTGEESVNNSTSETTPRLGFRLFVVFWVVATVWGTNRILNWWHGTDLSLLELTALAREATYEPLTHWRQLGLGLSVVAGLYYAFYSGSTSKTLWLDALVFGFVRVVVYYTFLTWFRVDGLDLEPLWTTRLTDRFRFLLGADPTTTTWRVIRDSLSLVFILLTHFLLIICIYLMVPTFGVDPKAGLGVLRLAVLWAQLVMTFMVADLFFFFLPVQSPVTTYSILGSHLQKK